VPNVLQDVLLQRLIQSTAGRGAELLDGVDHGFGNRFALVLIEVLQCAYAGSAAAP
jgi:hypothetical protein